MEKYIFSKLVKVGLQLLFQGRFTLTFDQLNFPMCNLTFRKRLNFLIQVVQMKMRTIKRIGFPVILAIEPINVCNLKCLTCATGAGLMKRPPSMMPFRMFRDIIDQVRDYVCLLVFWSWGEPFIHKDAFQMIQYAKDQGILVHSSTNGHFFNNRQNARKVIESGLDSLILS